MTQYHQLSDLVCDKALTIDNDGWKSCVGFCFVFVFLFCAGYGVMAWWCSTLVGFSSLQNHLSCC